ncbi:LTA synthase family protein [Helicobacter sp. 23-1044]
MNFYYFATYHTKIDAFIFGLKDDETATILSIIFNDYPLVRALLASVIFSVVCYKIAKIILGVNLARFTRFLNLTRFTKLPQFARITFIFTTNLLLLGVIFLGIRGSVGTFPLREDEAHFSANPLLNHIASNPIIASVWAYGNYQNQDKFAPINPQDLHNLERELFPIFAHNPQQTIKNPPHIVAVLMESFGNNALALDSPKCDLLGSFRAHFESGKTPHKNQSDFTFSAFLSAQNGTAASFAELFFNSPSATISISSVKNRKIALTPFDVYKNKGYEVIFITSGNRSWHNLGDYILMLGADRVLDKSVLIAKYPQSAEFESDYGVSDEYAFKLALEVLQNATKPTFIAMLTTSNHPPYKIPTHFVPPHCDIEPLRPHFNDNSPKKMREIINIFAYASSAFGDFVSAIKADSTLKDSTIIAGSGDHKLRSLKSSDNLALEHSVPLYMYIPPRYTRDFKGFAFERDKIGSHKDIFPTLYALSLNEYDFLTMGGRNLFDKNSDSRYNFAINGALWIDEFGIYPNGATMGYTYTLQNGEFVMSGESIALSQEKAQFMERYNALNRAQINYRIFEK